MSKFENVIKRIEEQMPTSQPTTGGTPPVSSATPNPTTPAAPALDANNPVVQKLVQARDVNQVLAALQELNPTT